MVIQHNMNAANATRQLGITANLISKSQEKLTSGFRINRAADDAAGLSISEKMRKMIRGLNQGLRNTSDGISFIQIADGAMEEVHAMIHRLEELAIQSANGTNSENDRKAINDEVIEIKKEINRIGKTSKFNGEYIFDQKIEAPAINISGSYYTVEKIDLFNSGYDSAEDKATYGGIIFEGERISWEDIDPNMVKYGEDGSMTFVGGEYYFSRNGVEHKIVCQDGDQVPQFYKENHFYGDIENIYVNGKLQKWSDFQNDKGTTMTIDTIDTGRWVNKETGDFIDLVVRRPKWNYASLGDIYAAANDGLFTMPEVTLNTRWAGAKNETAVGSPTSTTTNIVDANQLLSLYTSIERDGGVTYRLRAGKQEAGPSADDPDTEVVHNGVWLEEHTYDGWKEIEGSLLSWADVGLADEGDPLWSSGLDISEMVAENTTLLFKNQDDTNVSLSFNLKSITTSLDSVIDALDKVQVDCDKLVNSYEASATNASNNVVKIKAMAPSDIVSIENEYSFGRNYAEKTVYDVTNSYVSYDETTGIATLNFGGSSPEMEFTVNPSVQMGQLYHAIKNYVLSGAGLLEGFLPLSDVIDKRNYTSTGWQSDIFQIDLNNGWTITDGMFSYAGGRPLEDGVRYGGAYIDFKDIDDLTVLNNRGFDSTDGSMDMSGHLVKYNHLSITFTMGDTRGYDSVRDENGNALRYMLFQDGHHIDTDPLGGDFMMSIDLQSLINAGYTGKNLPSALIKILSGKKSREDIEDWTEPDGLDFTVTQYAAKGSALYVFKNYNIDMVDSNTTFALKPYEWDEAPDNQTVNITFRNGDDDYVNVQVKYDFSYLKDVVAAGTSSLQDIIDDAYEKAIDDIFGTEKTKVILSATDYTKSIWDHKLKNNNSKTSYFSTSINVSSSYMPKNVRIQHSGEKNDCTYIPKLNMNTFVLGLYRADCSTEEKATNTIRLLDLALKAVSTRRSLYGALQNRLEHTYNNRSNAMENLTTAESRIRDTDMADEMVKYSAASVIAQATQSMIAQANHANDGIIQLLTQ